MTIAMPDSITPALLPPGYKAYLGYADGKWPTGAELKAKFPAARIVVLTVTGYTLACDGIDVEPGNPSAAQGADWARRKLAAAPGSRPVIYADLESPGYSMPEVLGELARLGITRQQVRLLTAHYTGQAHICGPASCGGLAMLADGTQWTDQFAGVGGAVDMSALADNFFGTVPDWQEDLVQALPTLKQGDSGPFVKTAQGLCVARGCEIKVDGTFGPETHYAVQSCQASAHIAQDGVVGPVTWTVLMGV